jgi:RNA polymerase sigma factor (sigma-70 family)
MATRAITANDGLGPVSTTFIGRNQLRDYTFDVEYLRRLRARDASTLAHFCEFFYLPVRNKARHKCRRCQDADDLVQDVFLAALKRIDAGEPKDPAKLANYVFGICSKVLLRDWSKRHEENFVDLDTVVLKDVKEGADVLLEKESQARMSVEALNKLPPKHRDPIERVVLQGQDRADLAYEYGVSQANLRLILCRALKRLRVEYHKLTRESKYEPSSRQSREQRRERHSRKRTKPSPASPEALSEDGDKCWEALGANPGGDTGQCNPDVP